MFCKYCGGQIPDDSEFCEKCGNKLSGAKENRETDVKRKRIDKKEYIPKSELTEKLSLIEQVDIKLGIIRKWIYVNMILISIFFLTGFLCVMSVSFSSEVLILIVAYIVFLFLFSIVLFSFKLKKHFSLILAKIILVFPILESFSVTAIILNVWSGILWILLSVFIPIIFFVIHVIVVIKIWPILKDPILKEYFFKSKLE